MPATTIPLPDLAKQNCGFPEGTTLVFAREHVTLENLGLGALDNPNPLGDPHGTVYVTATKLPMTGTRRLRAWCIVFDDASHMTSGTGAVSDDWAPPD